MASWLSWALLFSLLFAFIFVLASTRKCSSCRSIKFFENNLLTCRRCRNLPPLPRYLEPSSPKPLPPVRPQAPGPIYFFPSSNPLFSSHFSFFEPKGSPSQGRETEKEKEKEKEDEVWKGKGKEREMEREMGDGKRREIKDPRDKQKGRQPPTKRKREPQERKENEVLLTTSEDVRNLIANFLCPLCKKRGGVDISQSFELEGGDHRIALACGNCEFECEWETCQRKFEEKREKSSTKQRRWLPSFVVLSYILSGQYYHDYEKTFKSFLKGVSEITFSRHIEWISKEIQEFFQKEMKYIRNEIKERNQHLKWNCSADGFYQIRGHHSPNCSAALFDMNTGKVVFAAHACKQGKGANYQGLDPVLLLLVSIDNLLFFFFFFFFFFF